MEVSQTTSAALNYLELLREHGPHASDDLASFTGEAIATAMRRLRTLERHGLVRQRSDRKWTLGPTLLYLASKTPEPLIEVSAEPITRLAQQMSCTVVLAKLAPPFFEIVLEQDGRGGGLRIEHLAGVQLELWQAPPGLALLGSLTPEELAEVEGRSEDPAIIADALQQLEQRGRIISPSRLIQDRIGIAAPILSESHGAALGSVTVSVPHESDEHLSNIAQHLLEAVHKIEQRVTETLPGFQPWITRLNDRRMSEA